jgi:hypothetical protein
VKVSKADVLELSTWVESPSQRAHVCLELLAAALVRRPHISSGVVALVVESFVCSRVAETRAALLRPWRLRWVVVGA